MLEKLKDRIKNIDQKYLLINLVSCLGSRIYYVPGYYPYGYYQSTQGGQTHGDVSP